MCKHHQTFKEIARHLSEEGIKGYGEKPLYIGTIRNIVSIELCIGQMTYIMTTVELQGRPFKNPDALWTRFPAFEPVVPVEQFEKRKSYALVVRRTIGVTRKLSNHCSVCLRRKCAFRRYLSMDGKVVRPPTRSFNHIGALTAAYELAGYVPPGRPPFGMNGRHWSEKALIDGLQKLDAAHGFISICPHRSLFRPAIQ